MLQRQQHLFRAFCVIVNLWRSESTSGGVDSPRENEHIHCMSISRHNGSIPRERFSWAFSLTWPGSMQIYWNKIKLYYTVIRKKFNSHGIVMVHQHGLPFIVWEHQYSRCNVKWKRFLLKYFYASKILQGERLYLSSTRPSFLLLVVCLF